MSATYEEKRAELRAVAEGGSAGRQAYQEGRQRLVSDQRAALDAALTGPVRFGEGTAAALDAIVRPVGETARARLDVAGERHDASLGALDAALSGALTQQGGARQLNYNETLRRGQQATDRNIELSEISRRKAEEARAAAEAEAAARAAEATSNYSQTEQRAAAEALGQVWSDEDAAALQELNKASKVDALLKVIGTAFGDLDPILQGGLMDQVWANMDDPDAIAALVEQYSPVHSAAARQAVEAVRAASNPVVGEDGRRTPQPSIVPRTTPARDRALEALLATYGEDILPAAQQSERAQQTQRHLYNQDAYTALFGDPLLAAGLFPGDFSAVEDELTNQSAVTDYILSGLTGEDLEAAEAEEMSGYQTQIAAGAGLTPGVVNSVAGRGDLDTVGVYEILADPGVADVVAVAVQSAMDRYEEDPGIDGKRPSKADITRDLVLDVTEALPDYVNDEYRVAIAAIAREQFSYLYG